MTRRKRGAPKYTSEASRQYWNIRSLNLNKSTQIIQMKFQILIVALSTTCIKVPQKDLLYDIHTNILQTIYTFIRWFINIYLHLHKHKRYVLEENKESKRFKKSITKNNKVSLIAIISLGQQCMDMLYPNSTTMVSKDYSGIKEDFQSLFFLSPNTFTIDYDHL